MVFYKRLPYGKHLSIFSDMKDFSLFCIQYLLLSIIFFSKEEINKR